MTQGYEAGHSGRFLEESLRRELMNRGFLFRRYGEDQNNLDLFAPNIVVVNAPYTSIYGCESRSEFVINAGNRRIRVECRWQESHGSVDEKFVYLMRNATDCMPENEVLILYGGEGAREQAIEWLKTEAKKITSKTIHVISINNFLRWVRDELLPQVRSVA